MELATEKAAPPKKNWAGIVISVIPVLMFAMGIVMSLTKNPQAIEGFKHYGYPDSAFMPLALVELACAVLYVVPRTSVLGAIVTTGYLGGAVATHVRIGEKQFVVAIIVGILVWLGLYLREPRLRELVPLRK
jgi:hypothetical protein